MKIIRDGKEIELTREEIRSASWEYDQICRIEDLASVYELGELEPNEEKRIDLAKEIEPLFDKYLGLNDTYWDAYWETARRAIKDWAVDRVESAALSYERGKMMRDDSEVEIDVTDEDEVWLCDYSENRGNAEFVKKLCNLNVISLDEIREICNRHGWMYVL